MPWYWELSQKRGRPGRLVWMVKIWPSRILNISVRFAHGARVMFCNVMSTVQRRNSTDCQILLKPTLLKIHNDLILAMDRGEVTSLILLDLSAAFDTVDHSILLTRLQNWFGLDGFSLNWFTSYLSSRSQAVSINDSISAFSTLSCGVPQGSVLGSLLFTLYYSSWLGDLEKFPQI